MTGPACLPRALAFACACITAVAASIRSMGYARPSSSGATVKVVRASWRDAKLGKAELARQGERREHGMMPCPDIRGVRWSSCLYPDG